uniref:Uncharacterized protein n=1 Tax=Rhizophora mucronata TaxID=61149 RepID=A0A2P2PB90_RHIMU
MYIHVSSFHCHCQRVNLGVMVRLFHYSLEVSSLSHRNKHFAKIRVPNLSPNPLMWEPCALGCQC